MRTKIHLTASSRRFLEEKVKNKMEKAFIDGFKLIETVTRVAVSHVGTSDHLRIVLLNSSGRSMPGTWRGKRKG